MVRRILEVLAIVLLLFAAQQPLQTRALSQAQKNALNSGVYYFNTDVSDGTCDSSTDSSTSSSSTINAVDLTAIAAKYDAFQSAIVKQVGGPVIGSYKADQPPITPASVLKLIIADVFLHTNPDLNKSITIKGSELYSSTDAKVGTSIKLSDVLQRTLSEESWNTGANILIEEAGGTTAVTASAHKLGYTKTDINTHYHDPPQGQNSTVVSDLTKAMENIYLATGPNYLVAQNALRSENHFGIDPKPDASKWGGTHSVAGNSAIFTVGTNQYVITLYINKDIDKGGFDEVKNAYQDIIATLGRAGGTSTPPDQANRDYAGNPVLSQAQLQAVKQNSSAYQQAAQQVDIPWQMIAVIHLRETGLKLANPDNGQGLYQFVDRHGGPYPAGPVSQQEFLRQSVLAAQFIKGKASANFAANQKLSAGSTETDSVKDTFYSYNGRAYAEQAAQNGFNRNSQAFEGSPYVMNRADAKRDPIALGPNEHTWGQVKEDNGPIEYPANSDYGAFVEYAALTGLPLGSSCPTSGGTSGSLVGSFVWPEAHSSTITSCFGSRILNGQQEFHPGLDIAGGDGTPILAAAEGKVIFAGPVSGYGNNFVVIKHNNGFSTGYGHMGSRSVKTGDTVSQGQQIGTEDSQGHSFGSHLHFNVIPGDYPGNDRSNVDPLKNGLAIPAGVSNPNSCH